ncbi:pentatricopeptide repeat-containing protein At1g09190-like [Phragmites australis]|uniref:pentatricopeptide repeat-containing protein At1g09190-like n=1 Tax=Phragmites australis TaxID=29695 RepID=UPI002D77C61E|nr:pentatricopeptide repeat-containing protein At1g09190-like [Phragmites australis]XP_062197467.1 pentatricopeptide repeat-containing protein At1g09190-like [Phragmites australis]XP_062197468.1 pentatricopeptide repeat-containing protein At1g09190-like [Phragmites australis]
MAPSAGEPSSSPSFASAITTPDGWHPRTAERRLLHLLHHCPTARRRPLELLAIAVRHALPSSPPSPHHHFLAALLLLSSPPTPALPLLRLVPPDPPPPLSLLNAAVKALSASSSPGLAFRLLSSLRRLHAPDRLSLLPLLGSVSSLPLLSALHSLLLRLGFLSHHAISLALLKPYPLPQVRVLFDEMPQKNRCTVAYNTLITTYLKAKDIRAARHLFDEMQRYKRSRRSVVSWNLMIAGCARCGRDDMAVWCFERMVGEGEVAPDDGTLAAVLPACGRTGSVGLGRWAHEYARKTGLLDRTVNVANAVVDMYCKCGDVGSAMEVFKGMLQRSVVSWNTMIAGFSLNGHGVDGIEVFKEMRNHGMEPNAVTFLGVLGCCAHSGAVDVGREIFQSMQSEHGVEPAIEHYGCMVDLLGRSGLLEEAHALIQGMPMKPNAAIWGALLSACRAHAGLGIAEVALKELINLEPWNSGNYVLLSNLYAETGRWEEAGEVRRVMRRMSVNKAPGQSLIEEDGFQLTNAC